MGKVWQAWDRINTLWSCSSKLVSLSSREDDILTLGLEHLFGNLDAETARVFGPAISGEMRIDEDAGVAVGSEWENHFRFVVMKYCGRMERVGEC